MTVETTRVLEAAESALPVLGRLVKDTPGDPRLLTLHDRLRCAIQAVRRRIGLIEDYRDDREVQELVDASRAASERLGRRQRAGDREAGAKATTLHAAIEGLLEAFQAGRAPDPGPEPIDPARLAVFPEEG